MFLLVPRPSSPIHTYYIMAPRTRAAKAREAAAACLLLDLSHDEVSIVTHELKDLQNH